MWRGGARHGFVHEGLLRHDPSDEADALGFLGTDHVAGVRHEESALDADEPRQVVADARSRV